MVGVDPVGVEEELPLAAADREGAGGDRAAGFEHLLEKRVAVHPVQVATVRPPRDGDGAGDETARQR